MAYFGPHRRIYRVLFKFSRHREHFSFPVSFLGETVL